MSLNNRFGFTLVLPGFDSWKACLRTGSRCWLYRCVKSSQIFLFFFLM
jgi:hypothetical protein